MACFCFIFSSHVGLSNTSALPGTTHKKTKNLIVMIFTLLNNSFKSGNQWDSAMSYCRGCSSEKDAENSRCKRWTAMRA